MRFVESDYGAQERRRATIIALDDPDLHRDGRRGRAPAAPGRARAARRGGQRDSTSSVSARAKSRPVFFGSAMNNFGVEPFLDRFIDLAPPPLARAASGERS